MKRTAIGAGAYVDPTGGYWARPWINRRRTWRKLAANTDRKAQQEANSSAFEAKGKNFAALAQLWLDKGCPGKRDQNPDAIQTKAAKLRAASLLEFFGKFGADEIRMVHLPEYAKWRRKQLTRKKTTGGRTIDLDLVTLSNILRFGVFNGVLEFNHIRADRPRYQADVRHARAVMPESAEIIHQIAAELLDSVRSEVMGWLQLFSEFTGCRTSELLRLKVNAKNKLEGGFIELLTAAERKERTDDTLGHLYLGRRSKNGLNPWAKIGPEFAEMIRAFQHWHKERHPKSEWYFPGGNGTTTGCVVAGSLGHAITDVCQSLQLPHITPHGHRAFYATKRLRDGARPVDIAAEMGDKTVALIENIYADNPDGKKLWWSPADGLPAWHNWIPQNEVDSFWTTAEKTGLAKTPNPL